MKQFSTYAFVALACTIFLWSCTKEKQGVLDVSQNAPRILSADVQPPIINLDSDTVCIIEDSASGVYSCTGIYLTARAIDPDGVQDIQQLSFKIYGPISSTPDTSGVIRQSSTSGDTALYLSYVSILVTRANAGVHSIEFQILDSKGLSSNVLRKPLIIMRNNSRPQISNLFAPDTVRRPNSGSRPVFLAITARDSDGLADIAKVFFKSVNSSNPNFEFQLFDDGNITTSGDTLAGDGRFSTVVQIFPTATLGTREFRFWARDNAGALSDSLRHFITVVPE